MYLCIFVYSCIYARISSLTFISSPYTRLDFFVLRFCAEGECASQAFLRRLRDDDPARDVYCDYFEEMYSRFSEAKEITAEEMMKLMMEKEQRHLTDTEVYELSAVATSADTSAAAKEQADNLKNLFKSKQLQPIIEADGIIILDAQGNKITDAKQLIASFQEFEQTVCVKP